MPCFPIFPRRQPGNLLKPADKAVQIVVPHRLGHHLQRHRRAFQQGARFADAQVSDVAGQRVAGLLLEVLA